MKFHDPQLVDLLAERYVLGVQRGAARRRFAAIAAARTDVRDAVDRWEKRLAPLAWSQDPMPPSDLVWQRTRRELGIDAAVDARRARAGPWAAVAAGLAAVAIVAGGGWWRAAHRPAQTVIERVPETVSVAVIGAADGKPLWLTRIAPVRAELSVRAVSDVEPKPDNDYELWALTDAGIPVSLGLLPQSGRRTVSLSPAAVTALATTSTLAVSLEPPGGSPEPAPTGPVLYTAALLAP